MATAPSTKALVAHLLRRTSFGPFPGGVDALAPQGIDAAIEAVLGAAPLPVGDPPDVSDDSSDAPVRWWLRRMADPGAGLHEKMTWFWHGLVTLSHDKVFWWRVEWDAHLIHRRHALGDLRRMLKELTVSPAMLLYLDGDWSTIEGPNENYARELQELFTMGQQHVTQANVTNGAKALTGWHVDWDTAQSVFIDEDWSCLQSPVPFLGRQVQRAGDVVDACCDHSATPGFIADKLWRYLVGTAPSASKLSGLASAYRESGLDARVLVGRILRDPAFLTKRHTRPRFPIEWVTAATAAAGLAGDEGMDRAVGTLWQMGQLPFYPPSVAGWPVGNRWLSPSLALARAAFAADSPAIRAIADASDPVAAALRRCSLYEVSPQTRKAMDGARASLSRRSKRATVLLALALASPEFALA